MSTTPTMAFPPTGRDAPKTPHFVDDAPFDPGASEPTVNEDERYLRASALTLIWWKFRRHRLAVISALVLVALYASLPFVELIAPYGLTKRHGDFL